MKWGSRAEITQVVFESRGVTHHMLYSWSFTLILHTIFHRVIFRGSPVTVCPMRNAVVGGKRFPRGQESQ